LRTATEDVDLYGTAMPKGAAVFVAIGGANRDPGVFDQPDRLMIDRPNASRHLSFSLGIITASAPRSPASRVASRSRNSRAGTPGLEMAGPPVRRPLLVLRGFETVPSARPRARLERHAKK